MGLSLLHRGTGLLLSLGFILLVAWLVSMAAGPECYEAFTHFVASWPVQLFVAACIISFAYHLANGIRHLLWDLGIGMERAEARRSGRVVIVVVLLLSALLLWIFFGTGVRA